MARLFDGVNQHLKVTSTPLTATPLAFTCWFKSDVQVSRQHLMAIGTDGQNNHRFSLSLGGSVSDRVLAETRGTGVTVAATTNSYGVNIWHHGCVGFAPPDDRSAWIDGGGYGRNTPNNVPAGIDSIYIGSRPDGAESVSGAIAEAALWDISVWPGATEDAKLDAFIAVVLVPLVRGYSPEFFPVGRVAYYPFRDNDNDYSGNDHHLTAVNGPTWVPHPGGIIYPTRTYFCPAAEVAVPTPTAYYPETVNCTGHTVDDSDYPPDTLTADNETEYNAADRVEASDDDGDGVTVGGNKSGHRLTFVFPEVNVIKLEILAKIEGSLVEWPGASGLFIWNFTDTAWDALQTRANMASGVEFTFRDEIYYNLSDYISSNTVHILLQVDGGASVMRFDANYVQLNVTGSAEIGVTGNTLTIVDGDATPRLPDGTDFNNAVASYDNYDHSFVISNLGDGELLLTGASKVAIGGANANQFSVTAQPTSPVAVDGSTTFTVRFTPTSTGAKNATLSIDNNDADENPFNFSILGTGVVSLGNMTPFFRIGRMGR